MNEHVVIRTEGMTGPEAYRLLCGAVSPRPVAWITTRNESGSVNAAPFSSYNYVSHSPPMLAINIAAHPDGRLKDTARNLLRTRELVVNVATEANVEALHATSALLPPETSEVDQLGLATLPGVAGATPRLAASPVQMECRLEHVVPLGHGVNTLYIVAVTAFHLDPRVYDGRYIQHDALKPLARLGGPFYAGLGTTLRRPAP
ncbi:MAG: flavin reductase family protein [Pigmentiphaga sp.]